MKGKNLSWFKSYLENRNQYLNYNNDVTNLLQMKCVIPHASIFRPLSFLIYVMDQIYWIL